MGRQHYPSMFLIARLTAQEKLRVVMDEKRGQVLSSLFRELQKRVSAAWKA